MTFDREMHKADMFAIFRSMFDATEEECEIAYATCEWVEAKKSRTGTMSEMYAKMAELGSDPGNELDLMATVVRVMGLVVDGKCWDEKKGRFVRVSKR